MEIRNYFRVIRKFIWWLIVPLVAVVVITMILSFVYKESYEAPAAFAINRRPQQKETIDYQYDSYYAIQANNLLADQFSEWLKGSAVLPIVYQNAGLKEESVLLSKEWRVKNNSPQDIEIIFRGRDKDRVAKLAKSAIETVNEKKETFLGTGDSSIGTLVIPTEVIVTTKPTSLLLNTLVGLLAGLIIGLIFIYFKAIFSPSEISNRK
jgi:capsular polysaccharide biosynthesis protein